MLSLWTEHDTFSATFLSWFVEKVRNIRLHSNNSVPCRNVPWMYNDIVKQGCMLRINVQLHEYTFLVSNVKVKLCYILWNANLAVPIEILMPEASMSPTPWHTWRHLWLMNSHCLRCLRSLLVLSQSPLSLSKSVLSWNHLSDARINTATYARFLGRTPWWPLSCRRCRHMRIKNQDGCSFVCVCVCVCAMKSSMRLQS